HVTDLATLADDRLALVGGDHARIGQHLAAAFALQRGALRVQGEVAAQQGVGQRAGVLGRGREVHVQAARNVVDAAVEDADVVLERAADDAGVVAGATAGHAEARTQVAGERIGGDDDAALDQHVVDRAVDHVDQLAHMRDLLRDVADHQRVGALVGDDAASLREGAIVVVALAATGAAHARGLGQRLEDRAGRVLVHLDVVVDQVNAVLQVDAGVLAGLLERGQLRLRRHPDYVAFTALVQSLGAQHDVPRLVPLHLYQAEGSSVLHRLRG